MTSGSPPPIKILWFTNIPMPAMDRKLGITTSGSGWWMSALLGHLRAEPGVRLAVAAAVPRARELSFEEDGVRYFVVSQGRSSAWGAKKQDVRKCADVIEAWKPDLIHVHGTERLYGLTKAWGLTDVPMVVSIQGLLSQCARNYFGNLTPGEILRAHRPVELVRRTGIWGQYRSYVRDSAFEAQVVRAADGIIGRTAWDRAWTATMNPDAPYYHVDEVMRPEFGEQEWHLGECRRNHVMTTTNPTPLKCPQVLLEAIHFVRRQIPGVKLLVAAGGMNGRFGFARFVRKRIQQLDLADHVELLGYLKTRPLVENLKSSHCFVNGSGIDNSPNSLCEAMLLGMPCIASYVGGVPSLVDDGRTGVFFQPRDPAMLADRIVRVLQDDDLAVHLGAAARQAARQRHDATKIVASLLFAYQDVLARSGRGRS
jgi:glycosyltransferase involved in cell wall biosynthesis